MIDRYEGHTPDGWYVDDAIDVIHPTVIHSNKTDNIIAELVMANAEEWTEEDYANARLIADAPDLLAEVKWLRSLIEMVSYDLACYPERLDQNKRQLEHNIRKWKGIEENEEVW